MRDNDCTAEGLTQLRSLPCRGQQPQPHETPRETQHLALDRSGTSSERTKLLVSDVKGTQRANLAPQHWKRDTSRPAAAASTQGP